MEAYFIIANATGGLKKFKLSNGEFVIIGRSLEHAQVTIEDDLCSSKHCKITMVNNAVTIEDLNSKNGIFLNGVRIIKQNLYLSDKVKIGSHILYIHEDKLGIIDKKLLTYPKSQDKRNFELTLEIERPKFAKSVSGRKKRPQEDFKQSSKLIDKNIMSEKSKRTLLYVSFVIVLLIIGFLLSLD